MPLIDSDAHVIETERTWDFMPEELSAYRPRLVGSPDPNAAEQDKDFWIIKGQAFPRRMPGTGGTATKEETREARDIAARLKHMDELGVDIQVLYPSILLIPLTDDPKIELALTKAYNRWMEDIWKKGGGRLRWAVCLPYLTMDKALEEMNWAHERGACAVHLRAMEGNRPLLDPYFHPVYREAARLNMPICVHSGNGSTILRDLYNPDSAGYPVQSFAMGKLSVVETVHHLILSQTPQKFPDLRWGIIETSASWIPYLWHDLSARLERRFGTKLRSREGSLLRDHNIFVSCQTDDDLSYVLKYAGEDNLVIGTDYGHADTSSEIDALRNLKRTGKVPAGAIDKILDDNARRLYAL